MLKDKVPGDMSELGLNRIRYCDAAPKTSNMVERGEETKAEERLALCCCEDDELMPLVAVDEPALGKADCAADDEEEEEEETGTDAVLVALPST